MLKHFKQHTKGDEGSNCKKSVAARKSFKKRINKRRSYVLPAAFVGDQEEEVKPHQIGEEEKKQKEGSEIF